MPRTVVAAAAALVIAAMACSSGGGEPTISDAAYDHSCARDADCVVVIEGDACCCGGGYSAINVSDLSRYQADLQRLRQACGVCNEDCVASPPAACVADDCTVCPRTGCSQAADASADAAHD